MLSLHHTKYSAYLGLCNVEHHLPLALPKSGHLDAVHVGPGEAGEGPTGRPRHVSAPHAAACPEKSLVLSLDQSQELALFGRAVDTDWSAKLDGQLIAST